MPEENAICRDFERGVCSRGDKCRFAHPENVAPPEGGKLPICKDYQNQGCDRGKCKFLHITQEEEAVYKATGVLPEHGGKPENNPRPTNMNSHMCKDFMNGKCTRGNRCKYSHADVPPMFADVYGKRSRVTGYYVTAAAAAAASNGGEMILGEENDMLRCKISELQKEILDLRQMNDTLYNQNAIYRSQIEKGAPVSVRAYETIYQQQYNQMAYPAISSNSLPTSTAALSAYSARPF